MMLKDEDLKIEQKWKRGKGMQPVGAYKYIEVKVTYLPTEEYVIVRSNVHRRNQRIMREYATMALQALLN